MANYFISSKVLDQARSLANAGWLGPARKAYKEAVNAVAEEAGKGLDALRSTIGDLGKSCKGCHEDFRTI